MVSLIDFKALKQLSCILKKLSIKIFFLNKTSLGKNIYKRLTEI